MKGKHSLSPGRTSPVLNIKKTVVIFDMSHDRVVGVAVKTAVALKNDRLFDSLYFSPPVF